MGGRMMWPAFAGAQAAAVDGVPKGLVSQTFAPLSNVLMEYGKWAPYPKAGDPKWATVPQAVREAIVRRADAVNASAWPEMLATDELEFKRNGNRSRFEAISFGRRDRLGDLVLAECMTDSGKYLDQIANGVWLICEESFWGVPAHLGAQRAGVGLADVAEPIVELFGAETAATMGWVVYLLGSKLDTVSPRIVERIHLETKRRILDPYFTRNDFGWMGLDGKGQIMPGGAAHHINNWNPWINSNVLTANLVLEKDAERRKAFVAKVCRSVDAFLADYSPDAGCEEGPGYWSRSAASFFDCCWTLASAHDGAGREVLQHPFTRAMGHYICNVHIATDWYVNYGDAHPHAAPPPDLMYRFGRATGDTMLAEFGAFDLKGHETPSVGGVSSLSRTLAGLLVLDEMERAPAHDALPRDAWYPHLGLMTAREKEGSAAGFYLACQAASNGRSHGHNDSGSFIVFRGGKPVFIDVGPEAYTAKTFSKDRYTLWTMQSAYHNLPTIGGVMQHEGEPYRASEMRYESNDAAASFQVNLAMAYPKQAGARRWLRTLRLDRAAGSVSITEEFELERAVDVSL
ncbi:MAG TPA: heparinase II/III family protein, partial [Acidobacteriaceae bacterium]|nr:heparinase II/III family protein [Acidobacteriaceae bacterium]